MNVEQTVEIAVCPRCGSPCTVRGFRLRHVACTRWGCDYQAAQNPDAVVGKNMVTQEEADVIAIAAHNAAVEIKGG